MRICSSCSHENPDDVERCRECGTLLDAPDPVEADIQFLLKAGRKIEAIKLYRERTGAGLKEAKEAVEAIDEGRGRVKRGPDPSPDILSLLREGQKIEAIKLYREQTGAGLKEAENAVESIGEKHGLLKAAQKSGCLVLLVPFLYL